MSCQPRHFSGAIYYLGCGGESCILNQPVDDPAFPDIIYRRGASGQKMPVLRGT